MIPGEMKVAAGDIEINKGRETVKLEVTNTGDRPVQVGSHYHFFEVNDALSALVDLDVACGDFHFARDHAGSRCDC